MCQCLSWGTGVLGKEKHGRRDRGKGDGEVIGGTGNECVRREGKGGMQGVCGVEVVQRRGGIQEGEGWGSGRARRGRHSYREARGEGGNHSGRGEMAEECGTVEEGEMPWEREGES